MATPTIPLASINARTASDEDYAQLWTFTNLFQAERFPDDPPVPLEEFVARCKNQPQSVDLRLAVVRNNDATAIVGQGRMWLRREGDNQHLVECLIDVLPQFRRRAIGRRLLGFVAEVAQREKRRLLQFETYDRTPASALFMQHIGATKGLEAHLNQLALVNVDHDLLRQWQAAAGERAAEFDLVWCSGRYPDDQLAALIALDEVATNDAPRGALDVEDAHISPEDVREQERSIFAQLKNSLPLKSRDGGLRLKSRVFSVLPCSPTFTQQWGNISAIVSR